MPHLAHIRLQGLWPHPAHPVRLLGRFDAAELTYALAPDLDMEWSRQPKETPDAFDLRICRDILAVRGVPEDPEAAAEAPRRFDVSAKRHRGLKVAAE